MRKEIELPKIECYCCDGSSKGFIIIRYLKETQNKSRLREKTRTRFFQGKVFYGIHIAASFNFGFRNAFF